MGSTGAMQAASYGMQGMTSLANAWESSRALSSQGKYQSAMFDENAKFADLNATDAINRGESAVGRVALNAQRIGGTQKAGLAAQGIDANSGSASQVTGNTQYLSALDELTARNNAMREAFGYNVQAMNYRTQGAMAGLAGNNAANNTLLTGGIQALSSFAKGAGSFNSVSGPSSEYGFIGSSTESGWGGGGTGITVPSSNDWYNWATGGGQ